MVAACNKSVDKKQELADLKNQAKEINAKIIALESAMGKVETGENSKVIAVSVSPVSPQTFKHFVEAQGNVIAENTVLVSPQTGGMIISLPVVVGIIPRKEAGAVMFEQTKGYMGYWEPSHLQDGTTGVGCIFLQPMGDIKITTAHFLASLKTSSQSPIVYYTGAAWDKAKIITSASAWFMCLNTLQQQLNQPLSIAVL